MSRPRIEQIAAGGTPGETVVVEAGRLALSGSATVPLALPAGSTATRPASPSTADIRWNTDDQVLEYFDGSSWISTGTVKGVLSAWAGTSQSLSGSVQSFVVKFDNIAFLEGDIALDTATGVVTLNAPGRVLIVCKIVMTVDQKDGSSSQAMEINGEIQRVSDSFRLGFSRCTAGEYNNNFQRERCNLLPRAMYRATSGDAIRTTISRNNSSYGGTAASTMADGTTPFCSISVIYLG